MQLLSHCEKQWRMWMWMCECVLGYFSSTHLLLPDFPHSPIWTSKAPPFHHQEPNKTICELVTTKKFNHTDRNTCPASNNRVRSHLTVHIRTYLLNRNRSTIAGDQCDTLCELHWGAVINLDMKIKRILSSTIVFALLPDESVIILLLYYSNRANYVFDNGMETWLDTLSIYRGEILPEVQLCRTTWNFDSSN